MLLVRVSVKSLGPRARLLLEYATFKIDLFDLFNLPLMDIARTGLRAKKLKARALYLLSLDELNTMPRGHRLGYLYAKPLYGSLDLELPTKEETINYIAYKRKDSLDTIRHILTLPHPTERKAKLAHYSLKDAYIARATIAYFKKKKKHNLGIRLLKILDNWDSYKEEIAKAPDPYLFLLEEFFRKLRVKPVFGFAEKL